MVINFDIQFDNNPHGIYYSGQVISGRVEIILDKPYNARGLYIKISGFAKCSWTKHEYTEHRDGKRDKKTVAILYEGRDDYLSSTTYLIGSENGNPVNILPGIHTYNFSCALPQQIPSSFEAKQGHVRYIIYVILERPWKYDHRHQVAFTVLTPHDLNYDEPMLRLPSQLDLIRSFGCGPCKSGPFTIIASIPQSGYVPGETIFITADIANTSKINISEISYVLRRIVTYYSQTPSVKCIQDKVDIVEKRSGGVDKLDSARYEQSIEIPSTLPTNIRFCRCLNIAYTVLITAIVSGPYSKPKLHFPITIGTIPLVRIPQQPILQRITAFPTIQLHQIQNNNSYRDERHDSIANIEIPISFTTNTSINQSYRYDNNNNENNSNTNMEQINRNSPPPSYNESVSAK